MPDNLNHLSNKPLSLNRRQIFTTITATIAGITLLSQRVAADNSPPLKPAALHAGAGVGLVSPASAIFLQEDLNFVVEVVRGLGLTPYLAPHVMSRYGYLGGKDRERAADINQFFAASEIRMLLPVRGGWGCSRILPYLDYELIRRNPKILLGFSDITALILGIYAQTGLITFHGPVGLSSWTAEQVDSFRNILFEGSKITFRNPLDTSPPLIKNNSPIQTIYPGKVQGKLLGGNLSILSTLVGTDYFPNPEGIILFVEDVGEDIYRIDRLLTHLKLGGILDKLAGFIFGKCTQCQANSDYGSLTLEEVVWDHIQPLGIPAWYGAHIGHLKPILTLPVGINVEIDAKLGSIQMLESALKIT